MNTTMTGRFFADVESNPLIAGLVSPMSRVQWADSLRYDPRKEMGSPSPAQMHLAIKQIRRVFAPTALQSEIACALYHMVYEGLIARDPRQATNRQQMYEIGKLKGLKFDDLPPFSPVYAAGMMIRGITKQGKSHVVQRTLEHLPQVIVRPANEECGWLEMKQLVHLTVPMPADASRAGFILAAFLEIDKVLGTKYAPEVTKGSVETQLVHLLCTLVAHRCGVLVIEEAQNENLATPKFGRSFVLFFLRVLNFGIPLVLVGNPNAFTDLDMHAQDVGRLSEAGVFHLDPATHWNVPAWRKDLMPNIWGWGFGIEDATIPNLEKLVWNYSGGFPGFLMRLRRETLLVCLIDGCDRVEERHIHAAYQSAAMRPLHQIIEAFVAKDFAMLSLLVDMPKEYFKVKWKKENDAKEVLRKNRKKLDGEAASNQDGGTDGDPEKDGAVKEEPPPVPQGSAASDAASAVAAKPSRGKSKAKGSMAFSEEDMRGDAAQQKLIDRSQDAAAI